MSNPEFSNETEYEVELRTPEERLEEFLSDISEEARIIGLQEFTDVIEATRANDKLNHAMNQRLKTIAGFDRIPVQLSGSGVKVPKYDWRNATDETGDAEGVSIILSDDALVPLKELESIRGTFAGTLGSVVQREAGRDSYSILVGAIFNMADGDIREVELGATGISLLDVMVRRRAYVNLQEGAEMISIDLEKARASYELADKISQEGLKDALFMKRLKNLGRALHSEDENAFTDLKNPRVFTSIGRAGALQSRRGPEQAALVSSAILNIIGGQRRMQFTYTELFEGVMEMESTTTGTISVVLMPESELDDTEPALIIDTGDTQKEVSFSAIKAVKF